MKFRVITPLISGLCASGLLLSANALAFDADEAQALAKKAASSATPWTRRRKPSP